MDAGKVVPLWEEGVPFLERLESVKVDLLYLKSELLGISEKIDGLQRMIYEQLRLSQDERNFILTILAVLFVPLSFLSGFFGMNIRIPKPSDFSGLSKFMNDSLTNLTLPEHNRSAALIAGIDSSGVQTWDMKSYWIAAVPLVLTVPLFLIAGGAVRWAIQSATKYAAYWRISTFIVGSILFLFVYVAMPILWTWRVCHLGYQSKPTIVDCSLTLSSPGIIYVRHPYLGVRIFYFIINWVGLGGFALRKLYIALRKKHERITWFLFTGALGGLMVGDVFSPMPAVCLLPIWAFLAWRFYRRYAGR